MFLFCNIYKSLTTHSGRWRTCKTRTLPAVVVQTLNTIPIAEPIWRRASNSLKMFERQINRAMNFDVCNSVSTFHPPVVIFTVLWQWVYKNRWHFTSFYHHGNRDEKTAGFFNSDRPWVCWTKLLDKFTCGCFWWFTLNWSMCLVHALCFSRCFYDFLCIQQWKPIMYHIFSIYFPLFSI